MPGWIIQGVRGEGKSLAAVGKIKEYMLQGRPVATNLNLYLENLLPPDNKTLAYRLPDHPRLEDFQLLPPAYDPKYKGEDKNGLLVLDELGTWLNSRNWSDKSRLQLLNWLFLSRKDHWDLILLAQDAEMIDAQVRTTLCDYLVQASRMDRQKIPYLAPILEFLGINAFLPKIHVYYVFYGMSLQTKPVEKWSFRGHDLYDGYDTNQKFTNGMEPISGTLIDMRASYSYIPASYLTRTVFIERLQKKIEHLKQKPKISEQVENMALKKNTAGTTQTPKIALLVLLLVGFISYRTFNGGIMPQPPRSEVKPVSSSPPSSPVPTENNQHLSQSQVKPIEQPFTPSVQPQIEDSFAQMLFNKFRPRLSAVGVVQDENITGSINFYDGSELVEKLTFKELHSLGVIIIQQPFGVEAHYRDKTYTVTSWPLKSQSKEQGQVSTNLDTIAANVLNPPKSAPSTPKYNTGGLI